MSATTVTLLSAKNDHDGNPRRVYVVREDAEPGEGKGGRTVGIYRATYVTHGLPELPEEYRAMGATVRYVSRSVFEGTLSAFANA